MSPIQWFGLALFLMVVWVATWTFLINRMARESPIQPFLRLFGPIGAIAIGIVSVVVFSLVYR